MPRTEYIIVGRRPDTVDDYCLISPVGKDKDNAEKILERMIENPDPHDVKLIGRLVDLKLEEVVSKECWWNDPFLAN